MPPPLFQILEQARYLREKNLIEGRKPNYYISLGVSKEIGKKADYSKNKGLDKEFYLKLITKSIKEHKSLSRKDIDELLWNKLPDTLNDTQKKNKIGNLISELRIKEIIENIGTFKESKWILIN